MTLAPEILKIGTTAPYQFIFVVYLLFAFGFPVLYSMVLMLLWVVPLTRKAQARWQLIAQIFNSWGALEVRSFVALHQHKNISALARQRANRVLNYIVAMLTSFVGLALW